MVDDGRTDDGRTDRQTTEHGYTISSPCEPDGSGELKISYENMVYKYISATNTSRKGLEHLKPDFGLRFC